MSQGKCPRCIGGNLLINNQTGVVECLQCGFSRDLWENRLGILADGARSNFNMGMGGDHLMTSRHKSGRYE
jgi:hypothetical protein